MIRSVSYRYISIARCRSVFRWPSKWTGTIELTRHALHRLMLFLPDAPREHQNNPYEDESLWGEHPTGFSWIIGVAHGLFSKPTSALILFLLGSGGLEHLVVLGFLNSLVDQLFAHASPIVIFAINGSHGDNVAG